MPSLFLDIFCPINTRFHARFVICSAALRFRAWHWPAFHRRNRVPGVHVLVAISDPSRPFFVLNVYKNGTAGEPSILAYDGPIDPATEEILRSLDEMATRMHSAEKNLVKFIFYSSL
ncbi:hypothetical protein CPC08DRAFT_762967 [Agrocybe pediades]|nr:hypothetical protein CPC08DRAFT_762967 [Agrocybe pediades]